LAEEGYDPEMGARPLKRVIQHKVEDKLSDSMLAEDFQDGDTVLVDVNEEDEIILIRDKVNEASAEEAVPTS
jgi:ATP-dependent Clp protease ATP-binding subunit ClpC